MIETIDAGEVVGWSWLFPPYRWHFDARAVDADVRAIAFDGACLRGKCEDDPALGYELMKRFAQVMHRAPAARRGFGCSTSMATASELRSPLRGPMVPQPFAVVRPRARDRRHLDARARAARRRAAGRRAGPVQHALRLRRRRGADLHQRRARASRRRSCHTIRAVGAVTRGALRAPRRARSLGVRGPFGTAWPLARRDGGDVVVVAGGIGLAPLRPALYHALGAARATTATVCLLYGARTPADLLYRGRARALARARDVEVDVTVDAADAGWRGRGRRRRRSCSPGAPSTRLGGRRSSCGPEVMMRFSGRGARRARRRRRSASTSRWSATCAAASATAATASSARR